MKKYILPLMLSALMATFAVSCKDKAKEVEANNVVANVEVKDTAYYGVCGEGTSMHNLELITDEGKKINFLVDEDNGSEVLGGLFGGDRVTVTAHNTEDGILADKVINVTSLMGKWTSLDRNFELKEDGSITSAMKAETKPYTAWNLVNSQLVLNNDTFSVVTLGPDSVSIENNEGIFVYKRQQ